MNISIGNAILLHKNSYSEYYSMYFNTASNIANNTAGMMQSQTFDWSSDGEVKINIKYCFWSGFIEYLICNIKGLKAFI